MDSSESPAGKSILNVNLTHTQGTNKNGQIIGHYTKHFVINCVFATQHHISDHVLNFTEILNSQFKNTLKSERSHSHSVNAETY